MHSFVLTNIDSKWRFGFCRHDPKSPTAMVIVTYLPWHDTFIRFLNVLADVRKNSQQEFESFLAEAYNRGVPEPGGCLKLQYDRPVQTFSFQRPQQFLLPSIPENVRMGALISDGGWGLSFFLFCSTTSTCTTTLWSPRP